MRDQHHGMVLAPWRRGSIHPRMAAGALIGVDQPVAAPGLGIDIRHAMARGGHERRVLGVVDQRTGYEEALQRRGPARALAIVPAALPCSGVAVSRLVQLVGVLPFGRTGARDEGPGGNLDHGRGRHVPAWEVPAKTAPETARHTASKARTEVIARLYREPPGGGVTKNLSGRDLPRTMRWPTIRTEHGHRGRPDMPRTKPLLAGTVVPVVIGLAVFAGGGHAAAGTSAGETPAATPQHQDPGVLVFASCNPCGPCNPCRPCAGACGPCGPCNPCNPCNPCAGACSPCGACNPCNPCNPCAALADHAALATPAIRARRVLRPAPTASFRVSPPRAIPATPALRAIRVTHALQRTPATPVGLATRVIRVIRVRRVILATPAQPRTPVVPARRAIPAKRPTRATPAHPATRAGRAAPAIHAIRALPARRSN